MTPKSSAPAGALADAINAKYGSFDKFKEEFAKVATGTFGSGWTWLVKKPDGLLDIADEQCRHAVDHGREGAADAGRGNTAKYIDYRNARPKFIEYSGTSRTGNLL